MRQHLLALLVSIAFIHPCVARIGETETEIATRYGQPTFTEPGFGTHHIHRRYKAHGYIISVHFYDGKSSGEMFTKTNGDDITDDEIAVLLSANKFGGTWSQPMTSRLAGFMDYKLGDTLSASYTTENNSLTIVLVKFILWYREAEKAERKNNLSGF